MVQLLVFSFRTVTNRLLEVRFFHFILYRTHIKLHKNIQFCILDEFCKYLVPELKKHTLNTSGIRRRRCPCLMFDSEVMTFLVLFHTMRHRDLKSFYLGYVCNHIRNELPNRLSYNRFRTPGQGRTPTFAVPAGMCIGKMYGNIHNRRHSIGVIQYKTCTLP